MTNTLKRSFLFLRGYNVTSVQTAPEALQLLKEAKQSGRGFDLVLTDLILPEVSGFDLIQDVVTGRHGISNVPVVVMSSEDSRESVMQVCRRSMDLFEKCHLIGLVTVFVL